MTLFDALFKGIKYAALGQEVTTSASAHCQEREYLSQFSSIDYMLASYSPGCNQ